MPAIKIENLSKRYIIGHQRQERYTALRDVMMHKLRGVGQRLRHPLSPNKEVVDVEEFWALQDINLEIQQGDRVGIIGRNGAGKSTMLKILSRITEPTKGRIAINGRVASLLEVGTGFHPELSGRENIFLNGAILGMSRAEIKRKFDEIVDFSGVEKFLDTPVKRYSSGMYVRLAFAVAAHLEPEILVVDEVLAVGDAEFQKKCLGKMEDVGREGRTVILVSHNMGAVRMLCSKSVFLEKGALSYWGSVEKGVGLYLESAVNKGQYHYVSNSDEVSLMGSGKPEVLEAYIASQNGAICQHHMLNHEILVYCKWALPVDEKSVRLGIAVQNSDGLIVLMSFDSDNVEFGSKIRCSGIYEEIAVLPSFLLVPGTYSINIVAGIPGVKRFFDYENILNFEICENKTYLSKYTMEDRLGLIATPLKWDVRCLEG